MSKKVTIPIKHIENFMSNDNVSVALRYRLKSTDGLKVSEWSPLKNLIFKNDFSELKILETLGYSSSNVNSQPSVNYGAVTANNKIPSQIDQLISSTSGDHTPSADAYKFSWTNPADSNIKNFDVYTCWNIYSFVATSGTLSAPTLTSGVYYGTLTLGTGNTNAAITLKSFHDYWNSVGGGGGRVELYATRGANAIPGVLVLGDASNQTAYTYGNVFNIRSGTTWSAAGGVKNISRTQRWTEPEYLDTTNNDSYNFNRKMTSNKLTATITAGTCQIQCNEDLAKAGVVPGTKLVKDSGDGQFSVVSTPYVCQVDYVKNIITVSNQSEITTAQTIVAASGTVSSATQYTATIAMSNTYPLYVGAYITATNGVGKIGPANVRVTSITANTSIKVETDDINSPFTNGAITNISVAQPLNHNKSGYIEFVTEASTITSTANYLTSPIVSITQNWMKPLFVQGIISASVANKNSGNALNQYLFLSVSEAQSTFFDAYGTIANASGTNPATATITDMSLPYSSNSSNMGVRIYSSTTDSDAASLGKGKVNVSEYVTASSITLNSTAAMNNGIVVNIRV
jgi:hypothetical protein